MTSVNFYHLQFSSIGSALSKLVEKALSSGLSTTIICKDDAQLTEIDNMLWTYDSDKFIPHGTCNEGFKDKQPVYLTTKENDNNSEGGLLFNLDSSNNIDAGFIAGFSKILEIFDGSNKDSVVNARKRWGNYKEIGCQLVYWKQNNNGSWSKG